jgi:hypothetical protein
VKFKVKKKAGRIGITMPAIFDLAYTALRENQKSSIKTVIPAAWHPKIALCDKVIIIQKTHRLRIQNAYIK